MFKCNDAGSRLELVGKVEDVADGRGPEGINCLGVIADHHHPTTVGPQFQQYFGLKPVSILIFVHQDMVKPVSYFRGQLFVFQHFRPVEQQIIIIEDILP